MLFGPGGFLGVMLVKGLAENLRRAIENPVRKAIRYTKANTAAEITVRRRGTPPDSIVVIQVRDHGPGVPAADLKRIFFSFHRVSDASAADGAGLGLAITEPIVRMHGGSDRATNTEDGGLILEMELPLAGRRLPFSLHSCDYRSPDNLRDVQHATKSMHEHSTIIEVKMSRTTHRTFRFGLIAIACSALGTMNLRAQSSGRVEWPTYGNDPGGMRYSPVSEINRGNVAKLRFAWAYHTGDVSDGTSYPRKSEFESTPIFVDGTLYFTTAFNRVIALNPENGKERWAFDPKINLTSRYSEGLMNRGVSTWLDVHLKQGAKCRRRIFLATIDARLISLDAVSGTPCTDFGTAGEVDLKTGIANIIRVGEYEETSPPAIIDDLVVVGSSIADNDRVDSPSGVVRAFDVRTGTLRWKWNPLPPDLSPTGAGNAWSMLSVDLTRDLLFVPTGAPSPDYHGAKRPGDDKWANSVVALRGKDGSFVWGFQLVHHDLWDYDTAPQPLLATLHADGSDVPVVIQGNKTGNLFVLHRENGVPVFKVEERSFPQSSADEEKTSATQPFPIAPPPLVPQRLSADEAWGTTDNERNACHERLARLQSDGIFTPPTVQGIVAFPGNLGGMNWSGGAFDPKRQLFVTNVNSLAMEVHLIPRDQYQSQEQAAEAGRFRGDVSPQHGTPYGMSRRAITSPLGLPCVPPPWGELVAVDLSNASNATIRWRVPLGAGVKRDGKTIPVAGTPNLGGPIITAGGLIFIGAAMDDAFRAFDVDTGKELWSAPLPAGAQATPMTYEEHGKQYVVIAAGGHGKLGTTLGDSLVAFALPR
jgi:quinoprotein glucose dehydrogenase